MVCTKLVSETTVMIVCLCFGIRCSIFLTWYICGWRWNSKTFILSFTYICNELQTAELQCMRHKYLKLINKMAVLTIGGWSSLSPWLSRCLRMHSNCSAFGPHLQERSITDSQNYTGTESLNLKPQDKPKIMEPSCTPVGTDSGVRNSVKSYHHTI